MIQPDGDVAKAVNALTSTLVAQLPPIEIKLDRIAAALERLVTIKEKEKEK